MYLKREPHKLKWLSCSKCNSDTKVDEEAETVICHMCCSHMGPAVVPPKQPDQEGKLRKPKGWKFMKVYVDQDGNVFQKGVEHAELKGTLPTTQEKPKKSRFEREQEKERKELKLAERYKHKVEKQKLEEEKRQKQLLETTGR